MITLGSAQGQSLSLSICCEAFGGLLRNRSSLKKAIALSDLLNLNLMQFWKIYDDARPMMRDRCETDARPTMRDRCETDWGVIWGCVLWCAVGVAVAALARAFKKREHVHFLSRIHALRSCGPLGYVNIHNI